MKKIKLNMLHNNMCPRCRGFVRYCNCDMISGKDYTDKEIDFINMQTDGRKKVPEFEEWKRRITEEKNSIKPNIIQIDIRCDGEICDNKATDDIENKIKKVLKNNDYNNVEVVWEN